MQFKDDKSTISINRVFQEILKTENSYNESMKFLLLALTIETQFDCHPLLPQFYKVIEALETISDQLLANIKSALEADNKIDRAKFKEERKGLMQEFFDIYKQYCLLYKDYVKQSKIDPKPFERINKYMLKYDEKKLGFESYIIMPVQRGPRYLLLINEIRKNAIGSDEFNQDEFLQLSHQIKDLLQQANLNLSSNPKQYTYQFGDITRYVVSGLMQWVTPQTKNNPLDKSENTVAIGSQPQ
jgi:hypothetical protein